MVDPRTIDHEVLREAAKKVSLRREEPPYGPGVSTGLTDQQQAALYQRRKKRRGGSFVQPPSLNITSTMVIEGSPAGTLVGFLYVDNGTGTYTFTKTADPSAKFSLSGSTLSTAGVWDYEVATFYPVTITADNGAGSVLVRTISIQVVDVPAPTLTAPQNTPTGQTTANLSVSTSGINGTLYTVVTTSPTAPTAAQVKAGQNNLGTAAVYAANQAISTSGIKTFSATGLTASTTYFTYFMHEGLPAEQSAVAAAQSFTTGAIPDTTAPILSAQTGTATGSSTATLDVSSNEGNGILYWVMTTTGTAPSAAQVKAGLNNVGTPAAKSGSQSVTATGSQPDILVTGLTSLVTYFAHFMQEDGALNASTVVSSTSFTPTPSAPVLTAPVDAAISDTTATLGVTTDTGNGTLYAVVTTSATPPTAAQVKAGQTNTGAAAVFAANQAIGTAGGKVFNATGLTGSTAYFSYFMHENATPTQSLVAAADGFTTSAPPDVTAPILTAATGVATSSSTATLDVSSNEGNGVLYWVVTQSAIQPTKAQVKAGQNHLSTPADKSSSQTVTATGLQPAIFVTGLSASTAYFAHFMQEDAALNGSSVASSSVFTTPAAADTTPPVLSSPSGVATGTSTATLDVSSNEANGTLYWIVSSSATAPTPAQVKLGQNNLGNPATRAGNQAVISTGSQPDILVTALVSGTTDFAHFMQEDAAGNQSLVVSSTGFTPPAVPVLTVPTDNASSDTTATIGVVTDTGNGTMYTVITNSATVPSRAQVKAGQNHLGAAAAYAGNQVVTATGAVAFTATGLTQLTAYFTYFMHENSLAGQSVVAAADGFTTTATPDVTPPTLTAPTSSATGPTTASIGVTTNENTGTLYWVVTQSGTAPSKAQVKAGQSNTGAAADKSGNQTVTASGVQPTISVTALPTSTTYFAHFMHEDASTNQSNVATSSSFSLIPAAPVLTAPIDTALSDTTATLSVTTNTANGTLYTVVTTSVTPPSAAQVKLGQTNTGAAAAFAGNQAVSSTGAKTFTATGLTALTSYFTYFMHENSTPTQSLVSAADGFTTTATPDVTAPILTVPTGVATGPTTATLDVSSNEANGALYWVITTSATAPTKAQVKAGLNNSGTAAVKNGSQAVTVTGSQPDILATGLSASIAYFAHFMHEDAATNQSNVVSSTSFTLTPAAPLLTAPTDAATGGTTATLGVTTDQANGTLYVVVTASAAPPTAAQVKLGQSNTGAAAAFAANQVISTAGAKSFSATGLTSQTAYFTYFMHENVTPTQSLVTAADGFTTADVTAPVLSAPTGVPTGPTTATLDISSNEANGILYWVITTSATAPTKAQIKAGQNNAGTPAVKNGNQVVTVTGSQTDILVTGLTVSTTYFAYFMQEDTVFNQSNVAASASFTLVPAAPVLTAPTDTQTGATTATLSVTTNTGNGTLYVVVTTSVTPPTAAQVKAGQNNAGTAAAFAGNQAVASTGTKNFSAVGLTASTAYFTYFMHENSTPTQSAVSAADGFTTAPPPDVTAPILSSPSGVATGTTTATIDISSNEANGIMYWVVTTSATQPTKAQVKAGQNNLGTAAARAGNQAVTATGSQPDILLTALTTSTTYFAHFMQEDAALNQSNVASSSSFTPVPAAPVLTAPTDTTSSDTTAALGVTTNTANGTLYVVVTLSATPPTAAQVKLGQNNAGTAAAFAANQAITTTGAKTFSATGLTASTNYFTYFMHENSTPTQSLVSAANGFTTNAPVDTTPPTLSSPTGVSTGTTTATLDVSTNEATGALYWVLTGSSTPPTAAQVKAGQGNTGTAAIKSGSQAVTATGSQPDISVTGLTALTTYFAYFMHEDAAANQSTVAAAASFTTNALPIPAAPTLVWASLPSDNKPDFDVGLPLTPVDGTETQVGDLLVVQIDTASYVTHPIASGDLTGGTISVTGSVVADGAHTARARLERTGGGNSAWSADAAGTIDTTPPPTGGSTNGYLRAFTDKVGVVNPADGSLRADSDKSGGGASVPEYGYLRAFTDKPGVVNPADGSLRAMTDKG